MSFSRSRTFTLFANELTERLETHFARVSADLEHIFLTLAKVKSGVVPNAAPPHATPLVEGIGDALQYREFGEGNSIRTVFIRERGF